MTGKRSLSHLEVLMPEEVTAILRKVRNPTAQSAMEFMYLCGVRAQETVIVMVRDVREIDEGKVVIFSTNKATGDKGACWIQLSKPASIFVNRLKENSTSQWLFPQDHTHISVESLKIAFEIALVESGIQKKVSLETLRHSWISAWAMHTQATNEGLHHHFHHCHDRMSDYYAVWQGD